MVEMKDEKIHVYCMPGLAAGASIFENIVLPSEKFEIHWLEWLLPEEGQTLQQYARRLCELIEHQNVVLIGVSFGGVVVQEMSHLLKLKRLIIVSSVKCERELPRKMKLAKGTKLFKMLPTSLAGRFDLIEKIAVGQYAQNRIKLYKKYLSVTDTRYLDWAIEQMICWGQKEPLEGVVHIHGDKDEIFPYKYIQGCITVPGGTHIMILNRFRWFNENLEEIILTGKLKDKKN